MMQPLRYPQVPGSKRSGTSSEAALKMRERAPTLREQVLDVLAEGPRTADECADALNKTVLAIRPRLSELLRDDLIHDTGIVRENISGVNAKVWGFGRRPRPTSDTTITTEGHNEQGGVCEGPTSQLHQPDRAA